MSKSITVILPDEVEARLEAVSSAEGVTAPEWISDAIRRQLFLREFEEIRRDALAELDAQGIELSDEDIFQNDS
jgi:predicted transcriptional regulator